MHAIALAPQPDHCASHAHIKTLSSSPPPHTPSPLLAAAALPPSLPPSAASECCPKDRAPRGTPPPSCPSPPPPPAPPELCWLGVRRACLLPPRHAGMALLLLLLLTPVTHRWVPVPTHLSLLTPFLPSPRPPLAHCPAPPPYPRHPGTASGLTGGALALPRRAAAAAPPGAPSVTRKHISAAAARSR